MINSLRNKFSQIKNRDRKVFFIGFNKCGTTSFHNFFSKQGLKSVHWRIGNEIIALKISSLSEHKHNLKRYLDRWTVYSDMTFASSFGMVDANKHFEAFHELYPDAYFILNDRDEDRWITSRLRHHTGRYCQQAMQFYGCDERGVESIWREQRRQHVQNVLTYFNGSKNFIHYHLETDRIEKVVDFLAPTFALEPALWDIRNKTDRLS